jgi:paraquat-inducible protein B
MANEQNLIPQAHKLTVEEASKGGQKSAQVRREKKTVQKILNDFLSTAAKDNPQVSKLAAKMGLQDDGSIKDLFTIVCTLNTLKDGNLSDLERLSKLLGEQTEVAETEAQKQAAFLDAVKKAVTDAD